MPTELGNLDQMTHGMVWPPFIIRSCAILSAIHARRLYDMTHDPHTLSSPSQSFNSNDFTGTLPTELGNLDQMTSVMV